MVLWSWFFFLGFWDFSWGFRILGSWDLRILRSYEELANRFPSISVYFTRYLHTYLKHVKPETGCFF